MILRHSFQYRIGRYQLTINFWFLILFLLVQTGLNELGYWQLSRAQEKQVRLETLAENSNQSMDSLEQLERQSVEEFFRVKLDVELAVRKNILVENKIQNGDLGFHVLNLVQDVKTRKYVLINRGWIKGTANRSDLPAVKLPASYWQLQARLYPINQELLSDDAELEEIGDVVRIPVLDTSINEKLKKLFKVDIEPYLLRVDKQDKSALAVEWAWVSMSPEKHLGYAFQWFALALAFLIVSLFVLVKRVDSD